MIEANGGAHAQPFATGGLRIVPNHRRFSDDGLGDGFHGHITDHRCGLIEIDAFQRLRTAARFFQRLMERGDHAVDVLARTFGTGRGNNTAGQKAWSVWCGVR